MNNTIVILKNWINELNRKDLYKKLVLIIFIITSIIWLSEANKIIYDKQLKISEYIIFNPNNLSKETYIRNESIGDFYIEVKNASSLLNKESLLLIPPQSPNWPYEGNVPLIRGIIYPNKVFHYENKPLIENTENFLLISCGYKVNNMGLCYPPEGKNLPLSDDIYIVTNKGLISKVATSSPELIRNTENIIIAKIK